MKRTRKSGSERGGGVAAVKRARDAGEDEPGNGAEEAVVARQPAVALSKETRSRLPIRCVFRIEVVSAHMN